MVSAHSKSQVDVDGPVGDVLVSRASDKAEQRPDVETTDALRKNSPAEPNFILIEGKQLSALVLVEGYVETVDVGESTADVNESKRDAVAFKR